MLNEVNLIGNLGKDPEARTSQSGMLIVKFSVATTKKDQSGQKVSTWHNVVCFSKLAEIAVKYLFKGSKVYISGEIKYSEYTDNQGMQRQKTEIIANNMIMLSSQNQSQSQQPYNQAPPQQQQYAQPQQQRYPAGAYPTPEQQAQARQQQQQQARPNNNNRSSNPVANQQQSLPYNQPAQQQAWQEPPSTTPMTQQNLAAAHRASVDLIDDDDLPY